MLHYEEENPAHVSDPTQPKVRHLTSKVQIESLQKLFELLTPEYGDVSSMMPLSITLENGDVLNFSYYSFNACFAKGRISEEELYKLLLVPELEETKAGAGS
ncbi:MAG: hypothetical protein PF495_13515 [Spirochaetales bacterium]|nr:hypothetical protein [Spirochaetales bacterium]